MKKNIFTLTELCVVTAILAILAAMLSPVIAEAEKAAGLAACSENLKMVGAGMNMYCDENAGYYPASSFETDGQGFCPKAWYAKVYKYVEDPEAFLCPSQTKHRTNTVKHPSMKELDYEINVDWMGKPKSALKAPEKTIILSEVGNKCGSSYFFVQWTFSKNDVERANGMEFRHDGYAATFRADGSVGAINEAELQTYIKDPAVCP